MDSALFNVECIIIPRMADFWTAVLDRKNVDIRDNYEFLIENFENIFLR